MAGEAAAAIAAREGVTAGHVRHEVSHIRRSLRIAAAALGVVVTLVLLFVGVRSLRKAAIPSEEVATPDWAPPSKAPNEREARALQIKAEDECQAYDWASCAEDLEKARALDPAGETDEYRVLREKAVENAKVEPAPEEPRTVGPKTVPDVPRTAGPKP